MRADVLRAREAGREVRVTNMELFFDLVYVFAFIQLSDHLSDGHVTLQAALETAVLFLAVWWAWNDTAWATGWIDPEKPAVIRLLAAGMVLSLVVAASIPGAFGHRAWAFAGAYVAFQCGRSLFMVRAFRAADDRAMARNYEQVLIWSLISGVGWLAGAWVHDTDLRLAIWFAAAGLTLAAPIHGYWLPTAGSTPISDWSLAGAHLAERCQLVVMIAFGETLMRLGEAFAGEHEPSGTVIAFLVAFLLTVSLWVIYFIDQAHRSAEQIHRAEEDAARIGHSAYTYGHMLMVGGLIVLAVAIHLAVEHPHESVSAGFDCVAAGGPVLYLIGIAVSKVSLGHGRLSSPLLGAATMALLTPVLGLLSASRSTELIAMAAIALALAAVTERSG